MPPTPAAAHPGPRTGRCMGERRGGRGGRTSTSVRCTQPGFKCKYLSGELRGCRVTCGSKPWFPVGLRTWEQHATPQSPLR